MLDPSQFITRTALDNFSIRYANDADAFIAESVFPSVMVDKSLVKVYQFDTANFRVPDARADSKAEANSVDYAVFSTAKTLVNYKLKGEVDPRDVKNADAAVADMKMGITKTIMDGLLLRREVEAATLATTSSNYPSDLTSALTDSTNRWSDTGGDPEANGVTARSAVRLRCGKEANALALSWTGLETLKTSPALVDRLKYVQGSRIPNEMLMNLLGVQYLFVGKAIKNTNVEGNATQTLAEVWGDNALFFVYEPTPTRESVCYGKTYMLNQMYSYEYEDVKRGSGAGRIQVIERGWEYVQAAGAVVSSSDTDFASGYLLRNIY